MDNSSDFHWLAGKPGESAFTKPFLTLGDVEQANKHPEFYRRLNASGDDRSYVLLAAMIVESLCDNMLRALIPGFSKLRDNRDFGFSAKIELVQALRLIPSVIPRCADCVRSVRNEFAHNLFIEKLADVKPRFHRQAEGLYNEVYQAYKKTHAGRSPRQILHGLVHAAIYGLHSYTINVNVLRRAIDNPRFTGQLEFEAESEFWDALNEPRIKG
jgi:hypothetical protein